MTLFLTLLKGAGILVGVPVLVTVTIMFFAWARLWASNRKANPKHIFVWSNSVIVDWKTTGILALSGALGSLLLVWFLPLSVIVAIVFCTALVAAEWMWRVATRKPASGAASRS